MQEGHGKCTYMVMFRVSGWVIKSWDVVTEHEQDIMIVCVEEVSKYS